MLRNSVDPEQTALNVALVPDLQMFVTHLAGVAKCDCSFFCVEVLRPSQPNGVMSSAVSLLNHTFTGQA